MKHQELKRKSELKEITVLSLNYE